MDVRVAVAVVPAVAAVASRLAPVAVAAVALLAVPVVELVVPVAQVAAPVAVVQVPGVAVPRLVHSDVPVVSRLVDVRASAPSVRNSTTCRHPHPRVRFVRWARGRRFVCHVVPALPTSPTRWI